MDTDTTPTPRTGGLPLAIAALAWAAVMLWASRATILTGGAVEREVTATAYALPGAISAVLVGGTGLALAALRLFAARRGATVRLLVATGTGLVAGLLAAGSVVLTYPDGTLYAFVAGTLAAAATIGGAVAGVRAASAVAAGGWASLAVFAIGFAMNLWTAPILTLFGAGDDVGSQLASLSRFSLAQGVISGLIAGIVPFVYLRGCGVRWPLYAAAGAGPGLILLVAEGLALTAGAPVIDLAGKVSAAELAAQELLGGSRVNNALIVLFLGAITAIILVGRTLEPSRTQAPTEESEQVG